MSEDTKATSDCACPLAGFCSRHQVRMVGRRYAICRGIAITPEKRVAYLKRWSNDAKAANARLPKAWDASMPSRGLGDTVAKVTKRMGLSTCGGCSNRQAWLNKVVPYRTTEQEPAT